MHWLIILEGLRAGVDLTLLYFSKSKIILLGAEHYHPPARASFQLSLRDKHVTGIVHSGPKGCHDRELDLRILIELMERLDFVQNHFDKLLVFFDIEEKFVSG